MKGYKGFNKDLTCRDFQYEIGKTYEMEGEPIICERGFHFCKELENVFIYYGLHKDNTFCEIEAYGVIISDDKDDDDDDNVKYCTNKIKIIRELSLDEILDIIDIKDKETFVKCYNDDRFNGRQMRYICLGLQKGLDVSAYAKPEFDGGQMCYISCGLEKGLDVSVYAKPEFNFDQMRYIYYGLEKGLDVNVYAKPEFNGNQMCYISWGLEKGLDISIYAKPEFNYSQMCKMYVKLLKEKLNERI